jgi:hypothetical protein
MSLQSLTGLSPFPEPQPSESILLAEIAQLNAWREASLTVTVEAIAILVAESIPALQVKINQQEYYVPATPLEYRVAVSGDSLTADQRVLIGQMCTCSKYLKQFHAIHSYNETMNDSSAIQLSQVYKVGESFMLGFMCK